MRVLRIMAFTAAALSGVLSLDGTANATQHRWKIHPRVPPVVYRLNPYAEPRWYGPGVSIGLGDWGSTPVHYPYADTWWRAGHPQDLACNMPSSPCWNEDRE